MTNGEWIEKEAKAWWEDYDIDNNELVKTAEFTEEWWNAKREESYTAEQTQEDYKLLREYCSETPCEICEFEDEPCFFEHLNLNDLKEWAKRRREELSPKKIRGDVFKEQYPNSEPGTIKPCQIDVNLLCNNKCHVDVYCRSCKETYWNEPVEEVEK